eukprot:3654694-Rhodomonas_salina.2
MSASARCCVVPRFDLALVLPLLPSALCPLPPAPCPLPSAFWRAARCPALIKRLVLDIEAHDKSLFTPEFTSVALNEEWEALTLRMALLGLAREPCVWVACPYPPTRYAMSGTDIGHAAARCTYGKRNCLTNQVESAVCLRACSAMPGTECSRPTRLLCEVRY